MEGQQKVKCAACFTWTLIFSVVVKAPVDSIAYLVPASPHLILVESYFWKVEIA